MNVCFSKINDLFGSLRRFLLSTHYTHYAPFAFTINAVATIINLIAKLPSMHQVRLFDINQKVDNGTEE